MAAADPHPAGPRAAPAGLTGGAHQLPYCGPALIVTAVAAGAILLGAVWRLRRREI